jgi:cyclopropane fatty-acyl-phospholipid synthase-like methyltransferase
MGYYHLAKKVEEYIQMAEGYNGQDLIVKFTKFLPEGSKVLEIGMGPGTDLSLLAKYYRITGSDYSKIFIDRYRKRFPDTDLLILDAITLDTNRKFHGIYSNKVLMHLSREELKKSIIKQAIILEADGIICHSFWRGDKEENFDGLRFIYYTADQLRSLFEDSFDIIKIEKYQEMEPDDSLTIIGKKKKKKIR